VPFPVKSMPPEGANVQVGLMVPLTIGALESVRAWFALLGF